MNLPNPFPNGQTQSIYTNTQNTTLPKCEKAGTSGTLISMILDESGSMTSCWDATISGFNEYIAGQKAATNAGAAFLTLIKFDSPHIKTVCINKPISEVSELTRKTYIPNGGTNLLDAIGHAIEQVNFTLRKYDETNRPGVIVVITTDGYENSSQRYNNTQIKALVKAAEESDWSFIFMGANIDSFLVGSAFGMNSYNSVNYSTKNMSDTYSSLNATTTRIRSAKMAGASTSEIYSNVMFTDDEKMKMTGEIK